MDAPRALECVTNVSALTKVRCSGSKALHDAARAQLRLIAPWLTLLSTTAVS
jgi:hypothetical protein